jgi:hypothetical protein
VTWLAVALTIAGALIAVGGAIRINFAYVRYFRSRKVGPDDRKARAMRAMELAYQGGTSAVITGAGCQVLLAGLVLGSYIRSNWSVLAPLSLVIGGAYMAWLSRRLIAQLRRST